MCVFFYLPCLLPVCFNYPPALQVYLFFVLSRICYCFFFLLFSSLRFFINSFIRSHFSLIFFLLFSFSLPFLIFFSCFLFLLFFHLPTSSSVRSSYFSFLPCHSSIILSSFSSPSPLFIYFTQFRYYSIFLFPFPHFLFFPFLFFECFPLTVSLLSCLPFSFSFFSFSFFHKFFSQSFFFIFFLFVFSFFCFPFFLRISHSISVFFLSFLFLFSLFFFFIYFPLTVSLSFPTFLFPLPVPLALFSAPFFVHLLAPNLYALPYRCLTCLALPSLPHLSVRLHRAPSPAVIRKINKMTKLLIRGGGADWMSSNY